MSNSEHTDSVTLTEAATPTTTTAGPQQAAKATDNDAAAARALAERERTFTTGGDPETPHCTSETPAPSWVAAAIARVRAPDRPSPFGVAQFPPLPIPKSRP